VPGRLGFGGKIQGRQKPFDPVPILFDLEGDIAMRSTFVRLMKDDSGATMIEYGLIAALVSVAAILALTSLGTSLQTIFQYVSTSLANAVPTPGP